MPGPIKKTDGLWHVDHRPHGRSGKRERRKFKTKAEAKEFYDWCVAEGRKANEWSVPQSSKKDKRTLSDLIDIWFELYGSSTKAGAVRKANLSSLCLLLGNPLARAFSAEDYIKFRHKRLNEGLTTATNRLIAKPISINTVNRDLAYLKSVYNKLIQLKKINYPNPLDGISAIKKEQSNRVFLELDQVILLLTYLKESGSKDVLIVAKICLATGARWSEAQNLKASNIRNGTVTFEATKSYKPRSVPISSDLIGEIFKGREKHGKLFLYCYKSFLRALGNSGIQLPENQASHVLRHTFASHYVMAGRPLKELQELLGHKNIQTTMIYAHLSPHHLTNAISCNPLAQIDQLKKSEENG